jgi:hypothetical protein
MVNPYLLAMMMVFVGKGRLCREHCEGEGRYGKR